MHAALKLALAASAFATPAWAERLPWEKGALTLIGENDSLSSGADRNYTSGVKVEYVSPINVMPKWARGFGDFTDSATDTRPSYWAVGIGQSIYTPQDITAVPAPPQQHPYAGWLYAQVMVAAEETTEHYAKDNAAGPRYIDLYELEFGIVGPGALGRQAQSGVHQLLDAPKPNGWGSQLHDEFAFAASIERRWRAEKVFPLPFDLEVDATPGVAVTLGTLRTEAKAGVSFRLGQNLARDYGPPRVRPALSGVGYFKPNKFSWYLFGGVDLRAVGRDLFLDGNTFRSSAHVERKPFVADTQAGLALQAGDWRLAYTYVIRTEEFVGQPTPQDFGSVALSWRF